MARPEGEPAGERLGGRGEVWGEDTRHSESHCQRRKSVVHGELHPFRILHGAGGNPRFEHPPRPGTDFPKTGKSTGVGIFTIVEEQDGWGLLKAYAEKRGGWISLAFTTRI